MFTKMLSKLLLLVGIVCMGIIVFLVFGQRSKATNIPDTPETREIMATMQRAYEVLTIAHDTEDVNKLSEVFIDDPDFLRAIGPERQTQLQTYIREILGSTASENFGYLTAMKNKITHRLQGEKLLKAALEKAKSENRELTPMEWQKLAEQNHGERPSLPNLEFANNKRQFLYKSLEIDGDTARAVYDEGVVTRRAILKRINGCWFVAGIF